MIANTRSRVTRFVRELEVSSLLIGFVLGLIFFPLIEQLGSDVNNFIDNLVPEMVGILFTVLILERLDSIRAERVLREQLVRKAHSRYNHVALEAIEELRALGYLDEGVLAGREMRGSHWENANLYMADLRGTDIRRANLYRADLVYANLEGAQVTQEQLASTDTMRGATMPDGTPYDGRYNLPNDFTWARREGINIEDAGAMAAWYGVSLAQYEAGQRWAREHLHTFEKRSAGDADASHITPRT